MAFEVLGIHPFEFGFVKLGSTLAQGIQIEPLHKLFTGKISSSP